MTRRLKTGAVLVDDPACTCCASGAGSIWDPRITYRREARRRNGKLGALVAEGEPWLRITRVELRAEHCTESSPDPILAVSVNGSQVGALRGDALRVFAAELAEVLAR